VKEVIVYWGCTAKEALAAKEPEKVLVRHAKGKNPIQCDYLRCPAYKDTLKNTFAMLSLWSFNLILDRKQKMVRTNMSQEFFDRNILVRDCDVGLASIKQEYLFFTEEKGLEISSLSAHLEENDFATNTTVIPGRMDIYSWFRVVEIAFHFNKDTDEVNINQDDALLYIRFHTNKKIRFVKYEMTERIKDLSKQCTATRENKGVPRKLLYYYDLFNRSKIRNKILKEIQKNIY